MHACVLMGKREQRCPCRVTFNRCYSTSLQICPAHQDYLASVVGWFEATPSRASGPDGLGSGFPQLPGERVGPSSSHSVAKSQERASAPVSHDSCVVQLPDTPADNSTPSPSMSPKETRTAPGDRRKEHGPNVQDLRERREETQKKIQLPALLWAFPWNLEETE